ncbi:MAG: hypothetical protein M1453_14845 [Acidobacteria bacterium]|nr:hypothetical protein [Acidobacteriota bacterium]MCL5289258.1 hypothetical protein [Acidobacteriota bacterium]
MSKSAKLWHTLRWLPSYVFQRLARRAPQQGSVDLIFALADHFEPGILPDAPGQAASLQEQLRRLEHWCKEYPKALGEFRDSDGFPFRHTFFYPAEQYQPDVVGRIAAHCQAGWGELEIHLHHGVAAPDTSENTRRLLTEYRDTLVRHGCLSRWEGSGAPRYAFVHGNWALANSAQGRFCGVDDEMKILAETGCYADLTLPSAPSRAQVVKINSLYECALPLEQRAPHRQGRNLQSGHAPKRFPLMVQGPLLLTFRNRSGALPRPVIENSELAGANPATSSRLQLWKQAAVGVEGRPDWIFIKLHCHGMDPRDEGAMFGAPMQKFLAELIASARTDAACRLHFTTAREMVNMILAACDGQQGDAGKFRDYRLRLIIPPKPA